MSLRAKLVLAFLAMSVLPLTVIVLYSYFSSLETLRLVALTEVSELTGEIGDRIETIRQDVDRGVERLSGTRFRDPMAATGQLAEGDALLGEIGVALGPAAPYVESLEFVPVSPAPPPPAPTAPVGQVSPVEPRPDAAPAPPGAEAVRSVVISLRELAESLPETGEVSQEWAESEEGQKAIEEISQRAQVVGHEFARQWAELDMEKLVAEVQLIEEERETASRAEESLEIEHRRAAEHQRRILKVEPVEIGDSEMVWRSNLLEQDEVKLMERREQESRLLLGREFDRSIQRDGRLVGRLRAQVSARKILEQVLLQAERDQGEIAFAIDSEGELHVAREEDRAILETLPLDPADESMEGRRDDVDDWIIVRVRDPASNLVYGIARPIGQSLAGLRRTAGRNFAVGLGLVALALAGIAPLSRRITRDLKTLTEGAQQLATGDLDARVPVHSNDEVGDLARTFNQMAGDLQRHQAQLLEGERLRKEHEIERRLLEAENTRRGRELEDARRFQLSLLPKRRPVHPDLEIGVFMQTATEVGGDYYDFSQSEDGSLVAAVGDATGHGARAGTMVTVIKSLFSAAALESSLSEFLNNASRTIRRMDLGRMAMALTLVRYRGRRLTVAAAGMPPVLIHRAADRTVQELAVESVPLGSMSDFAYTEREVELQPGDAVLLMSDGFPELANDAGEPLGYQAVHDLFGRFAAGLPQELIAQLAAAAEEWTAGSSPSDDITFVALRMRC